MRNKAPTIPNHYSQELKNICSNLLTKDPEKRVGINELLRKFRFVCSNDELDQDILKKWIQ